MDSKPRRERFIAPLIWFALTTAIALVLLLSALVVWLAETTGSFIASALIIGGFFGVVAFVIYLLAIRDIAAQVRNELDTVYEVAHAAKAGLEWVTDKVNLFLKLRGTMRGN